MAGENIIYRGFELRRIKFLMHNILNFRFNGKIRLTNESFYYFNSNHQNRNFLKRVFTIRLKDYLNRNQKLNEK